jgi:hypothetical protein
MVNQHDHPNVSAIGVIGTTSLVYIEKESTGNAIHHRIEALGPRRYLTGIHGRPFGFQWMTSDCFNRFQISNNIA